MTSEVGQILSHDHGGNQGWQRLTDEPDIRDVEVVRLNSDGPWQWGQWDILRILWILRMSHCPP
jgi:hypothetical protein